MTESLATRSKVLNPKQHNQVTEPLLTESQLTESLGIKSQVTEPVGIKSHVTES